MVHTYCQDSIDAALAVLHSLLNVSLYERVLTLWLWDWKSPANLKAYFEKNSTMTFGYSY
jgi:hypothetical protein